MTDKRQRIDQTTYRTMSTRALTELLRRDVQENILNIETVRAISEILLERRRQEDPGSIPPVEPAWNAFQENHLSLRGQLRRAFPGIVIALSLLLVLGIGFLLGSRPVITDVIRDLVQQENGYFTVDGMHIGSTREDVIAHLRERRLPYAEYDLDTFYHDALWRYTANRVLPEHIAADITWVSIRGNTRIEELGAAPIRRTYYFTDGFLTHVDLEADLTVGNIRNSIHRFQLLVSTLEQALGPAQDSAGEPWQSADFTVPGASHALWHGAGDSSLEVSGRYFQVSLDEEDPKGQGENALLDCFEMYISVRLGSAG